MKSARTRWIRWMAAGLAAATLAALLAYLFWPRPVAVDAAAVVSAPLSETVVDEGTARVREAYVVSAPVTGQLERTDLHVGDWVTANRTAVARLRPASAQFLDPRARAQAMAAISAARSGVQSAASDLARSRTMEAKAQSDLRRTRTLVEKGFAARVALENALTMSRAAMAEARAAAAAVEARRADLRAAEAMLLGPEAGTSDTVRVTAPASGYVTRVLQESSRAVQAGAPLIEIAESSGLEAAVEFLSQDAVRIREGMPAEVFDWGGPPLPGVVRRVEPQAFTKVSALGVEEQRVLVLIQLNGQPARRERLAQGYRVRGRVVVRQSPAAIQAPIGALIRDAGGWSVYRIEAGRARLTPVAVGALTDRLAEVRSGLSQGDVLVVYPTDRIRDGVGVRPRTRPAR
jgi:HlyD family secretion protein